MTTRLQVEVWSDIACPWCYVGKRRLEAALATFPHAAEVDVVWRAFELDPSAPKVQPEAVPYAERLAKKYRSSPAQAQVMIDRMVATAAEDGLDLRFDRIRPGNTFDAHRLIHLAAERGLRDAMKERCLRAYLTDGEAIGDAAVLQRLGVELGLDADEVAALLAGDRFAAEVRADEREAGELGISAVPFFVIDRRLGVSGAQPADLLRGALAQGWSERAGAAALVEGAACGPDGC